MCGKTVLHYICGPLWVEGDDTLMQLGEMCITRHKQLPAYRTPLVDIQDRLGYVISMS